MSEAEELSGITNNEAGTECSVDKCTFNKLPNSPTMVELSFPSELVAWKRVLIRPGNL